MIDEKASPAYNVRTVLASAPMPWVRGQLDMNMELGAYCLDRPPFMPAGSTVESAMLDPCTSLINIEV